VASEWVTGVVVCIQGRVKDAMFVVDKIITPGIPGLTHASGRKEHTDGNVLLVSGLEMGGSTDPFPAELLLEYVTGHLGSSAVSYMHVCLLGRTLNALLTIYHFFLLQNGRSKSS
jgi:hypothetical protein